MVQYTTAFKAEALALEVFLFQDVLSELTWHNTQLYSKLRRWLLKFFYLNLFNRN